MYTTMVMISIDPPHRYASDLFVMAENVDVFHRQAQEEAVHRQNVDEERETLRRTSQVSKESSAYVHVFMY